MNKKIIALSATAALIVGLMSTGVYAETTSNTNTKSYKSSMQSQKGDTGKEFKFGKPGENDKGRDLRGGKGQFGMDLDKIISESTTLTADEKAQLTAVNTEVKPLKEQLSALFEQTKTADDTTKAALKTEIKDLSKQIQAKLETIKDILAKVQPLRHDFKGNNSKRAVEKTTAE